MLLRTLKTALHSSSNSAVREASERLNQQTIFSHPTVAQLAQHLVQLCAGEHVSSVDMLISIRSMIQKYELKYTGKPISLQARDGMGKERVVVTGTTGGLGSHLLAVLLESEKVEKVWALNRKSNEATMERQKTAFEDKGLDVVLLESKKLVMVQADLENESLSLDKAEYNEVSAYD